ncbi:MAG: hypothetical protein GTN71_04705 [Anaerolineae bacterium]|nr:hypothetical protein [Anaerolineae bacterium]
MARVYGIEARRVYAYCGSLDWEYTQLDLVWQAASDFADLMQGKAVHFKARLAPVPLRRAGQGTDVWGARGRTYGSHISLSGARSAWADERGMKWVIVHELAHWWDQKNGWRLSHEMFAAGMWTEVGCRTPGDPGPPPTFRVRDWNPWYLHRPNMNPGEDWADSVATYVYWQYSGTIGWQISRSRWSYVGEQMDPYNWWNYHFYPVEWRRIDFRAVVVRHGRIES